MDSEKTALIVQLTWNYLNENVNEIFSSCKHDNSNDDAALLLSKSLERSEGVRIPNYFEGVIPRYSYDDFKIHFRLSRSACEKLLRLVGGNEVFMKKNKGGRPMIDIEKQLLIFLWFSGNRMAIRCGKNTLRGLIFAWIKFRDFANFLTFREN